MTTPMENELVVLEKIRMQAQTTLDLYFSDVEVDIFQCLEATNQQLVRYICSAMAQTIDEYKFPTNWKEALKEKFLPQFAKDWWPVKYTRITLKAVYPKIKIPKEQHYVIVNVVDGDSIILTRRLK